MALTVSATNSEVPHTVNVIYNQMLLENARPLAPYFVGTKAGSMNKNGGSPVIEWRRFNTSADNASGIAPTVSALAELQGEAAYMQARSASTVHQTFVTATMSKYGQFFVLNEEVDVYSPNGTMAGITRTLSISAGRSLNQLQRDIVEENSTQVLAGGVASDGVVVSAVTVGDLNGVINTLARNSAMPFTPMTPGSPNTGTTPIMPGFWAICHPDVAYDVSNLTGFSDVSNYSSQTQTVPGEFGVYTGAGYACRFIQTPDASIDADAGGTKGSTGLRGTSDVDLYTISIYGQDAIGSVGLGTSHGDGIYRPGEDMPNIEMIAKSRGSGGTSDPFNEIMTIAWKSFHAGAVLNSNWSRAIRVGATAL